MKYQQDIPGLCTETTAAGNQRWRVRVEGEKGKKITIPVGPDHEAFDEYYDAARQGLKFEKPPKPVNAKGSLDDLCDRFIAWMEDQVKAGNLSQLTLNVRRTGLTQARNCQTPSSKKAIGKVRATMPRAAFAHIRDSFGTRTGAAETCLKALRAAYTWGADHGFPENSPVFQVKSKHRQKGGATPWSDADRTKFLAQHGPATMARRWFLLSECTAGRIGDTHKLGPGNEVTRGDRLFLRWQPGKRGSEEVTIPVSWELMIELADINPDATAYLVTDYGHPFASSGSLDNRVRKWIIDAGLCVDAKDEEGNLIYEGTGKRKVVKKLATRSQHGIRKRRAEKIAEASGSVYEVMAHLSHSDPKTAAIYTKRIERARLAERAAERVAEAEKAQGVPRAPDRGTHLVPSP